MPTGGVLAVYGPFNFGGKYTCPSNAQSMHGEHGTDPQERPARRRGGAAWQGGGLVQKRTTPSQLTNRLLAIPQRQGTERFDCHRNRVGRAGPRAVRALVQGMDEERGHRAASSSATPGSKPDAFPSKTAVSASARLRIRPAAAAITLPRQRCQRGHGGRIKVRRRTVSCAMAGVGTERNGFAA